MFSCEIMGEGSAVFGVDIMVQVGDDGRELLLRLLVEVGDCNSCSEDGIVGMGNSHVGSCLGGLDHEVSERSRRVCTRCSFRRADTYKIVKFDSRNTLVDTRDNLLCDCCCIDMFGIEAITQSRDSSRDLGNGK